jgi:hypothetical protein
MRRYGARRSDRDNTSSPFSRGDDLSDFKPKTVDSCKKHGFTDDSGVTLRGLYVSAPELNKHIAHPSIKAALQKLIDAGPQDVYQDKWPHWDLVGGHTKEAKSR